MLRSQAGPLAGDVDRVELRVESGELTPTLKVKRRVIEKNSKSLIDSLYDATDPALVSSRE